MKNTLKKTIVMFMIFTMLFCNTVSVSAAEFTDFSSVAISFEESATVYSASYPYTSLSNALPITTSYKRLAYCSTSGSGFNCNLKVRCELNGISNRGVIMMKGKSGNILWTASSDNYVPSHGSYTFWCGSDVYSIWIKTTSGYGNAWIER